MKLSASVRQRDRHIVLACRMMLSRLTSRVVTLRGKGGGGRGGGEGYRWFWIKRALPNGMQKWQSLSQQARRTSDPMSGQDCTGTGKLTTE